MKDKKRVMEIYSFLDYDGIAAHLSDMAQHGWLFERICPLWWEYRRIEPKRMSFFVSYFPKASEFDPSPTPEQREFMDFCDRTGWRLAGVSAQMQIFYNENADPVPIETDPAVEVGTIERAAKKSYLPAHFALFVLALLQGIIFIGTLISDPIHVLSRGISLAAGPSLLILALVSLVELISYFRWRGRARKAAGAGEWVPSVSHRRFQIVMFIIAAALFAVWLASVMIYGNSLMRALSAAMTVYILLLLTGVNGIKGIMKRRGSPRGATRAATLAASVILAFGMTGLITYGGIRLVRAGVLDISDSGAPPMTVSDLAGEDEGDYSSTYISEGSLFMSEKRFIQYLDYRKVTYMDPERPKLSYRVLEARMPFLRSLIRETLLSTEVDLKADDGTVIPNRFEPVDPAPWHADEAYRRWEYDEFDNKWVLIYGGTAVLVNLYNTDPTQAQMDAVARRLGGMEY